MARMKNAEGYHDPTAYLAMRNVEKSERRRTMKYKVRVSELRYGDVVVEASSEEEAKTKATGAEVDFFDSEITDMTVEPEDNDRTYIVTEPCPNCGEEIEMRWNTDELGYEAVCPVCGERLMLCDECLHSEDNPGGKCDFSSDTDFCWRRKRETLWMRLGCSFEVSEAEAAHILGGDADLAGETLRKIVREGRFTPDGESYIPADIVANYNVDNKTKYRAADINFDV